MNVTTSVTVPPAVASYFDRKLLYRARAYQAFDRVAQQRPLKKRVGNTIVFRRFEALALALATLTEGVPPAGSRLSNTDIQATLQQWGDYLTMTDFGKATVENDLLNVAADVLGQQSGETLDALIRDVASAGTSVFRGGGVTNRTDLLSTAHKVDNAIMDRMIRFLLNQNAKFYHEMVNPGQKVSTFGIEPAFFAITHPDVLFTLVELPGWKSPIEYADPGKKLKGEVGAYKNLRFLMTTQSKVLTGAGGTAVGDVQSTGGNADVYMIHVFAKEAVAVVPLDGMSMENIIQPLGSGGVRDPLKQLCTSGWKHTGQRKILNDLFMCRGEVTAGLDNP